MNGSRKRPTSYDTESYYFIILYNRAIQGHAGENLIAPELSGHVDFFITNGKNSCFIEDALMMSHQSSNQDSSLEDEKARKEDRPSSSHLSALSRDNPDEDEPSDNFSKLREVHYYSKW